MHHNDMQRQWVKLNFQMKLADAMLFELGGVRERVSSS